MDSSSTNQPQPTSNTTKLKNRSKLPFSQNGLLDWIISNRTTSSQNLIQVLSNTPHEILASLPLQNGIDPLDELIQPEHYPLAYFHILLCRFENYRNKIDTQKTLSHAHKFCLALDRKQILKISRTTSDIYLFAQHLVSCSTNAGQLQSSIEPLLQLIRSYSPINILTPLHHELLRISLKTRSIAQALELTNLDINIDQQRYHIRYQDHLIYHYLAGTVQALGKNYQRAIHLLTIAVSAPGSAISQIQLDAYKKLVLVSLLSNSSPPVLPPYTHPQFRTVFKTSNNNKAYLDLMSLYEHAETSSEAYMQLLTMAEKNLSNFQKDNNSGLLKLCIEILPRKAIKKLIPIYTSIPIARIDSILGHLTEGNARLLIQTMIQSGELNAQIDPTTNVLKFLDDEQALEDPERTHETLKRIVERVQSTEQTIKEKSAEIERDKELLKRLIQDLRNSSAEKQQNQSSNEFVQSGTAGHSDRNFSGIVEEELVDVGMAWDD
ncbi:hypothetical protein PGT21_024372 [Puccinia graminis f. sp. tritici]|uniref:COP9 signalosome complex subunit 3 n=1 Tax=Puccinia graminis f. sp. tritici TaxID=56615 RepID=A0A5B0LND0_PUCGR|nr:hypothetical protein PGT21_024372 [Puccinia graminis f. sp. tritici]KAA1112495.1 hypothetical protein PGTUg99_020262 [Puccinia graminis f. sp. tritici]